MFEALEDHSLQELFYIILLAFEPLETLSLLESLSLSHSVFLDADAMPPQPTAFHFLGLKEFPNFEEVSLLI